MTAHYQIAQQQQRSTNNQKDHQRDTKQCVTPQVMPDLPAPYQQVGNYHWQLWSDEIKATLWYDRQCAQWNVRFDWPSIRDMQFQGDTPAMQMREKIIEAIDNRLNTYSVEVVERGTTLKDISTLAVSALDAINKIAALYAIGPYQFIARLVKESA